VFRRTMLKKTKVVSILAVLFVAMVGALASQKSGPTLEKGKNVEAGEGYVKQLLYLMDKDKNGKISKKEFMSFMEAEFDRLDVNHDGELDVTEIEKTHLRWVGK